MERALFDLLALFFTSELLVAGAIISARRLSVLVNMRIFMVNTMDDGKMSTKIVAFGERVATVRATELCYCGLWSLGLFASGLLYFRHFFAMCTVQQS